MKINLNIYQLQPLEGQITTKRRGFPVLDHIHVDFTLELSEVSLCEQAAIGSQENSGSLQGQQNPAAFRPVSPGCGGLAMLLEA